MQGWVSLDVLDRTFADNLHSSDCPCAGQKVGGCRGDDHAAACRSCGESLACFAGRTPMTQIFRGRTLGDCWLVGPQLVGPTHRGKQHFQGGICFFKHALEWNYFVGVILFYLFSRFLWKKTT